MGHLLDAGPGTARVEVRGSVAELAARARPTARLRIGFHEPNSPALIQQLVDALDAGAIRRIGRDHPNPADPHGQPRLRERLLRRGPGRTGGADGERK